MHWALVFLLLAACLTCGAQNPVTNGGFEVLDAEGRPVDWELLGNTVTITTDAHTGRYALRLERRVGRNVPPEIGLNRAWRPDSGQQGMMLAECKGGIVFWYKLLSAAPNASVSVQVIPMSARPFEDTGSPRAVYRIPLRHAGDGKWHQGKLPYDFTDNPKVKWVHVGVRLTDGAAVLIVDDIQYVERVGAVLQFEKMHFYPDRSAPDRGGMFTFAITNTGDSPSDAVQATVRAPAGWSVQPLRLPSPRSLAPGEGVTYRWRVQGTLQPSALRLSATDGEQAVEDSYRLEPRVELESVLVRPAMVAPGGIAEVVATVRNRGDAIADGVELRCALEDRKAPLKLLTSSAQRAPSIPPEGKAVVRWRIRAGAQAGEWRAVCTLRAPETPAQEARSTLLVTDALRRPAQPIVGAFWLRRGSDRIIGELRASGRVMARMPHLGSVVVRLPDGSTQRLLPRYGSPIRRDQHSPWMLSGAARDRAGARWTFTLNIQPVDQHTLRMEYACVPDRACDVLAFEGPMLLVGDGSTAEAKTEALLPGLEWLIAEEVSSNDLDIARDHPDRIRFVPHPHKVTIPAMGVKTPAAVVGLLWNVYDQWSRGQQMPQPVFAVPDRLKGTAAHRIGLIAPNVPAGLGENRLTAEKPFRVTPDNYLRLSALVYVNPQGKDALSVVDAWLKHFQPDPPLPAPQGSDLAQLAWSMKGYTRSLWLSDEEGWLPFLGGPAIWRKPAFRLDFLYDLLKALTLLPDHPEASEWRALVEKTRPRVSAVGVPQAEDMQFEHGDAEGSLSFLRSRALELIQTQGADGSWGFDADRRDQGVFQGMDYHLIGPPDAVEVGTCARNAYEVLRYARISGSEEAYRAGAKTLELMRRFTVPRAAQVWEVPFHTPDILAAADAVDAYIEGYWYSGAPRWLAEARRWARAGLPFIYMWNAPGKPWMRYGSIPVFGSTWYSWSWFGHIVQWNGLRYAYALLKLCEADRGAPPLWRQIALGITRSAMYQQSTSGENLALWPDSYHTVTDVRAAWDFAPRLILKNVYHFLGHEEEPRTLRLPNGVRLSSRAVQIQASEEGETLRITLCHPPGEGGNLLVSGVSRPQEVLLNGQPLPEVQRLTPEARQSSCWKYSPLHRALVVWLPPDVAGTVVVRGVQRTQVPPFPRPVTRLRFEFDEDDEGWSAANDLQPLEVRDGVLVVRATGGDPYMIRHRCQLEGDAIGRIRLRLRGRGNGEAQFYWTTARLTGFDENKVLRFQLPLDGEWHEVVIPVGEHPLWRGERITAIRLDPGSASGTVVEIDWMRGE
ncbi:MAG: NEW3 domain-containing protein [bacterium]|nr:NEW3 domain-containing protein [bacterium]